MDEQNTAAFDDDWGDITLDESDVIESDDDNETAADEGTEPTIAEEPAEEKPAETDAKPENDQEADHSFKVKYMGEEKELSREEAVAYAQKGMNYDKVVQERDSLRQQIADSEQQNATRDEAFSLIDELAKEQGQSVQDFLDTFRANKLSRTDNIPISEALNKIKFARKEKELQAKEAAMTEKATKDAKAAKDAAILADIQAFRKEHPEFDSYDKLPEEVKEAVGKGKSYTEAYMAYEIKRLKAQLEAEKQNKKNKERSVGSASSTGAKKTDPFDAIWYDGT